MLASTKNKCSLLWLALAALEVFLAGTGSAMEQPKSEAYLNLHGLCEENPTLRMHLSTENSNRPMSLPNTRATIERIIQACLSALHDNYPVYLGTLDQPHRRRLMQYLMSVLEIRDAPDEVARVAMASGHIVGRTRSTSTVVNFVLNKRRNKTEGLRMACLEADLYMQPTQELIALVSRDRFVASLSDRSKGLFEQWSSVIYYCQIYLTHIYPLEIAGAGEDEASSSRVAGDPEE